MYQVLFTVPGDEDDTMVCLRAEAPDELAALREVRRHYPEAEIRHISDLEEHAA